MYIQCECRPVRIIENVSWCMTMQPTTLYCKWMTGYRFWRLSKSWTSYSLNAKLPHPVRVQCELQGICVNKRWVVWPIRQYYQCIWDMSHYLSMSIHVTHSVWVKLDGNSCHCTCNLSDGLPIHANKWQSGLYAWYCVSKEVDRSIKSDLYLHLHF